MSKTKLEYAKACLRVDFVESDAVLQGYLDAAETRIINDTQRSLKELCAMSPDGMSFPADLQTAAIALAGAWYANPEAYSTQASSSVPEAYEYIISPYKRLV